MMNLQTKINIVSPDFSIDYGSKLLLLGSCFAENMGEKFSYYKFNVDVNPCGIVYNPCSVANVLKMLLEGKIFTESDLLYINKKWVSLFHHGSFSNPDQALCLEQINRRLTRASSFLECADLLIITWGTSWVYRYKGNGEVVSNCHKMPAKEFVRYRLSVDEIVNCYFDIISRLRERNSALRILFTVSPIRHWKDGAHGNQLSKATLLLAIDQLMERLNEVYYFPAFEIVLDELRDYRYYADDMLHLSPLAVNYIWERLLFTFISPQVLGTMNQIGRINKGMLHRPFDANSEEYYKLLKKLIAEIDDVTRVNSMIDFSEERRRLLVLLDDLGRKFL